MCGKVTYHKYDVCGEVTYLTYDVCSETMYLHMYLPIGVLDVSLIVVSGLVG
jgi:hypothetical protein